MPHTKKESAEMVFDTFTATITLEKRLSFISVVRGIKLVDLEGNRGREKEIEEGRESGTKPDNGWRRKSKNEVTKS